MGIHSTIDKALLAIAPTIAVRRIESRITANALMSSGYYNGASKSHRANGWSGRSGDANAVVSQSAKPLREVARNLERNNPIAVRALNVLVNNVVGSGIHPHAQSDDDMRKEQVEKILKEHCDTTAIDADGNCNLAGLERLAFSACVRDGAVLIRKRERRISDGLPIPLQLQVMEIDFLDKTKSRTHEGANKIVEGIEFDLLGRRVAYWLYDEHPQNVLFGRSLQSRRIPASEIIHLFKVDRPGQINGVSWFAPVVSYLNDINAYLDAQLIRQKIAACFSVFRMRSSPSLGSGKSSNNGSSNVLNEVKITPGMVTDLDPGSDVKFASPPGVDGLEEAINVGLRFVAGGMGITFEALSSDVSRVNFTSFRAGHLEMWRNIDAHQHAFLLPAMCLPIGLWIEKAIKIQTMDITPFTIDWTPPAREMVDPAKEIPAEIKAVRAGFWSLSYSRKRRGFDSDDVNKEILEDNQNADKYKFIFDSDARYVTQGGQAQQIGALSDTSNNSDKEEAA